MPTNSPIENRIEFFDILSEKRGQPGVGGEPLVFLEKLGAVKTPVQFNEPDPLTFRSNYYYNARLNELYKRKVFNKYYAVWLSVSTI